MNKLKKAIISSAVDEIKSINQDTVIKHFCFTSDFSGFAGHFPGHPVLPAFVQILTALVLMEEKKGYPLKPASVQNARFRIPIGPDQNIEVLCVEHLIKEKPGCETKIGVKEGLAASFQMIFYK